MGPAPSRICSRPAGTARSQGDAEREFQADPSEDDARVSLSPVRHRSDNIR